MKRQKHRISWIVIIICFIFSCSQGQVKKAVNALDAQQLTQEQRDLIYQYSQDFPNKTQLSFAFIDGDKRSFYGVTRKRDSLFYKDNHQNIFEIGSVSKVFTATLLAKMVVNESLSLDQTISDLSPVGLGNSTDISLKQLSNHTSGLPRLPSNLNLFFVDQSNPYKDYGPEELEEYLASSFKLESTPGEKYAYSNLGTGLLGYLLRLEAKKSYETLLQEMISEVYAMPSTTTVKDAIASRLVSGLNPEGKNTSNWDMNVLVGAGGIYSSVEDLSQFSLAQFNEKDSAIQLTQKENFRVNENMQMGLGWHVLNRQNGKWIWHNGGTGGYSSSFTLNKSKRKGVLILSNVSAFNPNNNNIDQLCFALLKTL